MSDPQSTRPDGMDLLWYRPEEPWPPPEGELYSHIRFVCLPCDVYEYPSKPDEPFSCFSCGQVMTRYSLEGLFS